MEGKQLSFSHLQAVISAEEGFERDFGHAERSEGLYT